MNRTCIIVSPYFPPSMLAGVHRARHLAKHLPAAGWHPVIVCVDETYHEERLDPDLALLVPASVEIVKVRALPVQITRPLGVGEISLRARGPLRNALFRLLSTRPIGAVLITGSPYYPMLFASEIKRRFGVPVVLDFQDPWVSAWAARQPRLSKSGLSHWLAGVLEPRAVRDADFVTSVSDTQNADMALRYPWLDSRRMAAIPIGGDPEDYAALREIPVTDSNVGTARGFINLSYVGTVWPPVMDTIRTLLRAAARLRTQKPKVYEKIRLNFIGTSANPCDTQTFRVRALAEAEGVADIVNEVPQRLAYLQALSIQANSEGILVFGSNEPHYTASKIYAVLMSGRPFLSVFHSASSSHEILARAGGGQALAFSSPQELAALEAPLANVLVRIATAPEEFGRVNSTAYEAYEARNIAAQYATIFEQLDVDRNC